MKEQERAAQTARDRRTDRERERREAVRDHKTQMPVSQWTEILSRGVSLTELSPELLEELAGSVGNSSLVQLLKGGGNGGPAIFTPDTLAGEGPEPEVNRITTAPPELFPLEGWPETGGQRTRPEKPWSIRDRG